MSRPLWARELKLLLPHLLYTLDKSRPLWARELKQMKTAGLVVEVTRSRPLWARELKLICHHLIL